MDRLTHTYRATGENRSLLLHQIGGQKITRPYRDTSRVRVGRGIEEIDQPSCWAVAVTPKPPVSAKKAKWPTDRQTDRAGCRVAYTRRKIVRLNWIWVRTSRTITVRFILTDSFWSISIFISDQGSKSEQLPEQLPFILFSLIFSDPSPFQIKVQNRSNSGTITIRFILTDPFWSISFSDQGSEFWGFKSQRHLWGFWATSRSRNDSSK